MASDLSEMKKIQNGVYDCGKNGYTEGSWWTSKDVKIYFPKAYKSTPRVQLSIQLIHDDSDDDDSEFGLALVRVTNRYFIMRCQTYKDKTIKNLVAAWMSVARF